MNHIKGLAEPSFNIGFQSMASGVCKVPLYCHAWGHSYTNYEN